MKTAVDVLAGLLAVKELENKILKERVNQLYQRAYDLEQENNNLYLIIADRDKVIQERHIGFKTEVK